MPLREYTGNAAQTRLVGSLAEGATTSFTVLTGGGAGYPSGGTAPFVVVIDRGTTLEEKILVTSRLADTFNGLSRGYDGTTPQGHAPQAVVEHVLDAATVTEVNAHVNDDARDDHSQYLNSTRHSAVPHTAAMIQDLTLSADDIGDGVLTLAKLSAAVQALLTPTGVILPFTAPTPPTGWLICNGAAVSRTTYAALWDLFRQGGSSSPYGNGDGSTTFNLPDMRLKVPVGKADSGTGSALGSSGGSKDAVAVSHNHTQDAHGHTQDAHDHTQNSHDHDFSDPGHLHSIGGGDYGFNIAFRSGPVQNERIANAGSGVYITYTSIDPHGTGIVHNGKQPTINGRTATNQGFAATNQPAGSSGSDANLQPYQVFNYIIKV